MSKKVVVTRKPKVASPGKESEFSNCGSGDYLGDIEVTDAFFETLLNINPHYNRISKVPRGPYTVTGHFDLDDGHFVGFSLRPAETPAF